MLNLILIEPDSVSSAEAHELWKAGIDTDDWDYMVVINERVEEIEPEFDCKGYTDEWDGRLKVVWYPKSYALDRMLNGCCANTWYKVKVPFLNEVRFVGVAYHG